MAYVLTSLSGNLISAASAGWAPTNSGDVSAIASAYATGDYVEKSATEVAIGSANVASSASFAQGIDNTASSNSFAQGNGNSAILSAFAQGIGNTSKYYALAQGNYNSANSASIAQGSSNKAYQVALSLGIKNTALYDSIALGTRNGANSRAIAVGSDNKAKGDSFAQGSSNTASYTAFAQGTCNSAINIATVFGQYNLRGDGDTATGDSAAFAIGDGTASGARHDLMLVTKDGEITMYSSTADTVGTGIMSSIRAISAAATGGGVDSATVSAIASSYAESAASGKLDATAYDSAEFYTTSNPSGFIDAASASAIASAYQVVSATATQLNAGTAYLTSVNETPISASRAGNAANASLANSAWYDGTGRLISSLPDEATVSSIASAYAESAVSSKADSSALSSYALSSDVSGVIDTVSSNSASWAGGGATGNYLTSQVGSGQATFSTALQDGMDKRPALMIEAQRSAGSKMYPRMMVTDWNDTTGDTHSGTLLSNAFEFYICPQSARGEVAPSGIVQSRLDASRLQFNVDPAVSSFTKSSEFTRSGMKLGLSGNSASWVVASGNTTLGGLITLDDCSGTTGRIVASSIPYWDGKLDGSASSSYYTTANESGYVDSAYVESQVSSKQDTLTFDWDADSAISSINGSALAGQGGGGTQVQSNWIESSTAEPSYIQNKPAVFGLLAGAGVKITESASAITIATEIPTYNTTTDVGKVLQVTVSGLAWVSLS